MKVAFGGLALQYQRLQAEIDAAVRRVLASGYYIGGPEVEAFERAFAPAAGAPYAVGVANGTDAISLALLAVGVSAGDEVIVPAVSAYPTVVGVVRAGAVPCFVDVDPATGLLDPSLLAEAVTPRTRAILPVHLYGTPSDMAEVTAFAGQRGLVVVEDCAQAHAARIGERFAGTFGAAAAWSFYPTKNLGAVGDAGAVTTASAEVAARLRRLRNYGQSTRYEHVEMGFNSRLDPLQAAILAVKLRHLEEETARRRAIAARYDAALARLEAVTPVRVRPGITPSRHLYPVLVREGRRAEFQDALAARGVETLIHYPIPMPDQRATPAAWRRHDRFPCARSFCARVVSLPLHPDLPDAEVDHVATSVRSWAGTA